MVSILGFAAAASVELNRLDVADARMRCADSLAEGADRSWRAQVCAAYRQDMAIVNGSEEGRVKNRQFVVVVKLLQSRVHRGRRESLPKVFEFQWARVGCTGHYWSGTLWGRRRRRSLHQKKKVPEK